MSGRQLSLFEDENIFRDEDLDAREGIEDIDPLTHEELRQSVVSGTDWTTETIVAQIDKGNILLTPRFQRRDAWVRDRKSLFIESLFLGLPIPQIVLAESQRQKGNFIVIDGKQRLLTIRQFAASAHDGYTRLHLHNLKLRHDLNGLCLKQMIEAGTYRDEIAAFENQTIRTVVIRNWPNEKFLYQVFWRLNTGSVPLSPQELRLVLHPGPFVDYVDEYSLDSPALRKLLSTTNPDFRMRDVELLVRYYAFMFFLPEYDGNLKAFLDRACSTLNKQWAEDEHFIKRQAEEFELACETSRMIFGPDRPFRKWLGNRYEPRFNRAIFDIMVFYFSEKNIREAAMLKRNEVERAFQRLCVEDSTFLASLELTTKSLGATFTRLSMWASTLAELLNIEIYQPTMVNNRIK